MLIVCCWLHLLDLWSDYHADFLILYCSSRRFHCWIDAFDIPLSYVILRILPSTVVKDHRSRPSRSSPDFVTLLLSAFVIIVAVPPGLYLKFQWMFVSDIVDFVSWQELSDHVLNRFIDLNISII